MVELPKCDTCKKPTPLSLWDVELEVYKSGEGTQSVVMLAGFEPLSVKRKAQLKDLMAKPYDWDKVYKPLKLEEQAKIHGVQNPFGSGGGDDETGSDDWEEKRSKKRRHEEDDESEPVRRKHKVVKEEKEEEDTVDDDDDDDSDGDDDDDI
jgi:hypothetical protein